MPPRYCVQGRSYSSLSFRDSVSLLSRHFRSPLANFADRVS
ncbi:unnamed protein product [Brassica oleracea]